MSIYLLLRRAKVTKKLKQQFVILSVLLQKLIYFKRQQK